MDNLKKTITVETEEWVIVKKEKSVWDWSKIPTGSKFRGIWDGKLVEGRIYNGYKEDKKYIWLCQNRYEGNIIPNKLGYEFSWAFNVENDIEDNIISFEIELDPEYVVPVISAPEIVPLTDDYEATIYDHEVKVGCQTIPFEKVEEVYNKMKERRNK